MLDAPDADRFLEIDGLTKTFGGVRAVDRLNLTLGPDQMLCIIGPNGCGKTTLFNLITGYLKPTEGSIRFCGRSLAGRSLHDIARAGIVRKFQVPSVFPGLTVEDNLRVAAAAHPSTEALDGRIEGLLDTVGLAAHRRGDAGHLSHGQRQWLELALVLATEPRLVLLDEPTAGMTRAEKAETVRLIHSIHRRSGLAAILIEHDMAFVEALDCPVAVMLMGRIIATGSYAAVRADPAVRRAYMGPNMAEPAHA